MIEVGVTSTVKTRLDRKLLEKAAALALQTLGSAQASIAVIGDRRMRGLNRDALGHDYVTDVLSFDHGDSPEGRIVEIIVCAPHAQRQAHKRKLPVKQELARYVIHGALHCAGYDDHTEDQRAEMWTQQEKLMRKLFGKSYRETTAG